MRVKLEGVIHRIKGGKSPFSWILSGSHCISSGKKNGKKEKPYLGSSSLNAMWHSMLPFKAVSGHDQQKKILQNMSPDPLEYILEF